MPVESQTVSYAVHAEVLAQQVGDELILLDQASERYLSIDPVGARIWNLLTAGLGIDAVTDQLSTEYDVAPSVLERDVSDFVARVTELGLLHPASAIAH